MSDEILDNEGDDLHAIFESLETADERASREAAEEAERRAEFERQAAERRAAAEAARIAAEKAAEKAAAKVEAAAAKEARRLERAERRATQPRGAVLPLRRRTASRRAFHDDTPLSAEDAAQWDAVQQVRSGGRSGSAQELPPVWSLPRKSERAALPPSARRGATSPRTAPRTGKGAPARPPAKRAATKPVALRARAEVDWSLLEAGTILAVVFAAMLAQDAVMQSQMIVGLTAQGVIMGRAAVLAVSYAIQVGALALLTMRSQATFGAGLRLTATGGTALEGLASFGIATLLLVVVRIANTAYLQLIDAMDVLPEADPLDVPTLFGDDLLGIVLAVAMVAVIGPLVEELVFRGVVFGGLANRFGDWPAIVVSALLFGLFHWNARMFATYVILGIGLGWLAAHRRSLWPAIGLHAAYNAMTVAAAFVLPLVT